MPATVKRLQQPRGRALRRFGSVQNFNRVFNILKEVKCGCRRAAVCAAADQDGQSASGMTKDSANQLSGIDKLVNRLLQCKSQQELSKCVAENITSFDQKFWLRVAARADTAESEEQKAQLSSLASSVMHIVDAIVRTTEEQLCDSGTVVQDVMRAGADERGEWTAPLPPEKVEAMRQAMLEQAESLDEAFLSTCFAYMKKAGEDGLDGVVHVLQVVLQLYSAQALGSAYDGGACSETGSPEEIMVEDILAASESQWEPMLVSLVDAGELSEAAFSAAMQRKMEATVLSLKSGSYAQRVQAEYLKELDTRGKAVFQRLASEAAS